LANPAREPNVTCAEKTIRSAEGANRRSEEPLSQLPPPAPFAAPPG
jgi:hypothetical protein